MVLPEKLTGPHLVKKGPELYGTRRFITMVTVNRHLSLSTPSQLPPPPSVLLLGDNFDI